MKFKIFCFLSISIFQLTFPITAQIYSRPNINKEGIVFKATLPQRISESSGLIYTDGRLWTLDDSGGPAAIFSIDTLTGEIKQTVYITNYPNIDWEDITADDKYIYIGDFGNNHGKRKDLKVLKVPKSSITDSPIIRLNAEAIKFSYSDQFSFKWNSKTDYDCEAIICLDTSLYLFSKDKGDAHARTYRLSKTPGTYTISPYSTFDVQGRICGAAYNPEINEVALIGYSESKTNAFIWILNNFHGDSFFSGNKTRIEIGSAFAKWKTEGVTYLGNEKLFISCEASGNSNASLYLFTK